MLNDVLYYFQIFLVSVDKYVFSLQILFQELNVETNDTDTQTSQSQAQDEEKSPCETESNAASFRVPIVCPKTRKVDDVFTNEALECMKTMTQAVTNRDTKSFTILGDFVADSLRTSNRPNM